MENTIAVWITFDGNIFCREVVGPNTGGKTSRTPETGVCILTLVCGSNNKNTLVKAMRTKWFRKLCIVLEFSVDFFNIKPRPPTFPNLNIIINKINYLAAMSGYCKARGKKEESNLNMSSFH